MSQAIAVVRTAWVWAFFVTWTAVMSVVALLMSVVTLGQVRRQLATWLAPVWARPLFWSAGIRLRFVGTEHLSSRSARVMVMNHSSTLDVLLVCALGPPGLAPLVKRELMYIPVMNLVFWALGGQFVDRGQSDAAVLSINRLGDAMRAENLTAVIAPEGTRSMDGTLQRFKLGAFHIAKNAGVDIVPLVIHGAHELMQPRAWLVYPGEVVAEVRAAVRIPQGQELREFADGLHDRYAEWLAAGPPAPSPATV